MTLTPPMSTVELVGIALLENKRKQTGWLCLDRLRARWIEFMVIRIIVVNGSVVVFSRGCQEFFLFNSTEAGGNTALFLRTTYNSFVSRCRGTMVASTTYVRTLLSLRLASSIASSYNLNEYPTLKYGTAWKKDRTADLVTKAIKAGFRHIDTACQPRHYHEAGTGDGWVAAAKELGLARTDIWLQTKFSGLNAHDPNNVPYDVTASLEDRVRQSLKKSLENLKTDYIDSLIMHGPENNWDDHWKVSK